MRYSALLSILVYVAGQSVGYAAELPQFEKFQWHLVEQLSCLERPDPTGSFLYLNKIGRIDLAKRDGYDSVSCFEVKPNLNVRGLKIGYICGYKEDYLYHYLFPKLYWRGPGTSPGQRIAIGVTNTVSEVREWVSREAQDFKGAIGEPEDPQMFKSKMSAELECSDSMLQR